MSKLRHKTTIFITYVMVAMIGYFTVPMLFKSLSADQSEHLSRINVPGVPNEVEYVSDLEVMSYQKGVGSEMSKYLICSIDDDPDGMNAHGIYDPIDLAVTVKNLVRLNVKHLFLGTHAHWPDLPPEESNTLRSQLELLDSCILSTPLRRSTQDGELPEYLLNSSIPVTDVIGKFQLLPVVNNLSLAPTLDVPQNCEVGFSQLESEVDSANIPLLAVWGDKVILSSLLLERMHQLDVELSDLKIVLGKYIKLGDTGNLIPINEFGYFIPTQSIASSDADIISAEITSVEESPVNNTIAILTASGQKADSYRAIESPLEQLSQLSMTSFVKEQVMYQRVPWWSELLVLLLIGILLSLLAGSSKMVFMIWTVVLGAGVYLGSFGLHSKTNYFVPILSILGALLVCLLVRLLLKKGVPLKKKEKLKSQIEEEEEVPKIKEPKKLMTLAEKMRAEEGEQIEHVNDEVPEEILSIIEQLEEKKIPSKESVEDDSEDFDGDFCDLTDVPDKKELGLKSKKAKKTSDSKSK